MKAKPWSRRAAPADAASWSMRTPSASSTSAEPDSRGHRPVAVLGDRDAGGRRHQRGRRRDVERAAAVAAGPDDVDRAVRGVDADDPLAHRGRETGQLVDGLAAHPQAHQQGRQLGRRRLAVHHRAHRRARLVHRQRAALDDRGQGGAHDLAHRDRPLADGFGQPGGRERPGPVVEQRGLPFAGLAQEVREQVRALRRQHALRVELDALERQRHVADAHDHPVDLAHRRHPQLRGERRGVDRERVVAGRHERRRHALEQAGPVVGDLGRLAMDEGRGTDDRRAERGRHRLHPEADAQERERAVGGHLDRPDRDPGIVRIARAGRDDDAAQVRGRVVGQVSATAPISMASLRTTRTSAPAAWSACTRLNVKLS